MTGEAQKYFDRYTRRAITVLRYAEWVRREVVGTFEYLLDRIKREILLADPDESWDRPRLEALILLLFGVIEQEYDQLDDRLTELLLALSSQEALFFDAVAREVFGPDTQVIANLGQLTLINIATFDEVLGGTRSEHIEEYADQTKRRVSRQLRQTFSRERSAKALIDDLLGQASGKRVQVTLANGDKHTISTRRGGALKPSRNELNSFARTSTQSTSQGVLQAALERTQDAFPLLQANTILDGRTSVICVSRTGGLWYAATGEPHPASFPRERFPGYPPWHRNCRTTIVPVPDQSEPVELPSIQAWLESQPESVQLEVLGRSRLEMWKAGKLGLHQLLDQSGNPLTLAQLRQRV